MLGGAPLPPIANWLEMADREDGTGQHKSGAGKRGSERRQAALEYHDSETQSG